MLHAIHDFLPRHLAGSEIYAFHLSRELARRHQVYVLCAEYDGSRPHGATSWRVHDGLPVIEIVNNWAFPSFADSYQSPGLNRQLEKVLRAAQPDVLHLHSLLNLSMDLPVIAKRHGIPTVATLHDYTLVCPSGGQRVHLAEEHICDVIDVQRCSRCFAESPFYRQMAHAPASTAKTRAGALQPSADDITRRLDKVRQVFALVDLFVAPSPALGAEYIRLGLPAAKLLVSDYGFVAPRGTASAAPRPSSAPLRIGFVGTLAWHKGVHILIDAVRQLPPGSFELLLFADPEVFPAYVDALRARAGHAPVRFMGRFDPSTSAAAYAQIDVLVVPSLWMENSPLVIHEAFMAGVPVVGARRGGIPDLVTDGQDGLLYDAFSPAALAAALTRLIDDPGYGRRLGSQAPHVKTIGEDAREWETIYERVTGHDRTSAAAS